MFAPETLCELYAHMEWADATVWSAAVKARNAFGDDVLRERLSHVHKVQYLYLCLWTNRSPALPTPDDIGSLAALRRWARPHYGDMRGFLAGADAAALATPLPEAWRQRMQDECGSSLATVSVGLSAYDLANHTAHHRGQINARLRELEGEPPSVDYILWVWTGRPAAEWGEASAGPLALSSTWSP